MSTCTSNERTSVDDRADGPQQRERGRLLERDDQEEQPRHEGHDHAVEQEDDLETTGGPAQHWATCRPPALGERIGVVAAPPH